MCGKFLNVDISDPNLSRAFSPRPYALVIIRLWLAASSAPSSCPFSPFPSYFSSHVLLSYYTALPLPISSVSTSTSPSACQTRTGASAVSNGPR